MNIPVSYKQLTVEQYQKVEHLINGGTDEYTEILSILSGLTVDEIEQIDIKVLKNYYKIISFLKQPKFSKKPKRFLWIKGNLYKATSKSDDLNTARYRSISTLMQDGNTIPNLHHIAALSYSKLTWRGFKYQPTEHNKLAELMKTQSTKYIYPVVFFCLKALEHLNLNSPAYLEAQAIIKERMKEMEELIRGGILQDIGVGNTL